MNYAKVGYFVSNRNSKSITRIYERRYSFLLQEGQVNFIEGKTFAKDTLKAEQIELAEILIAMSNSISTIFYILETGGL